MDDIEDILFRIARQLLASTGSMTIARGEGEPYSEYGETEDNVVLTIELPGANPADIRVFISRNSIEVRVEEMGYETMHSTPPIKPREAEIRCRNGVLEVKTPRA
ncbi:MAG: Hsp20/alpha crystallin family protein [Candidatus Altiarchaeota archaeon]